MHNEEQAKQEWHTPEVIDLDINIDTEKLPNPVESSSVFTYGPS